MPNVTESDVPIIDLLRRHTALSVGDFMRHLDVTATAVRQRLNRLMGQGFVERRKGENSGPGRPVHLYVLTEAGRKLSGANFADLAMVLWEEIRSIRDPEVRRGLLKRLSSRLADQYRDQINDADELPDRMKSLAKIFASRDVPFEVSDDSELPVLRALACPYPALAEQDRGVCAVEKMMMSELLGESVSLGDCRLDGGSCCTFEVSEVS